MRTADVERAAGPAAAADRRAALLVAAVLALAALVLLGKVVARSGYGFELTDEGYYLLSLARPWDSTTSTSQFGFVYHPLYLLAGGDVARIRGASQVFTFALAAAAGFLALRRRLADGTAAGRGGLLAVALALGAGAFLLTSFELPQTPSYNTLVFQGLLLGTCALVAIGDGVRAGPAWHLLLGLAGAVMFAAKPTTAAAFGALAAVYLAAVGRFRILPLLLALGTAAVAMAALAWSIDGSVAVFADRLRHGVTMGRALLADGQGGSIWRLDPIAWSGWLQAACAASVVAVAALTRLAVGRKPAARSAPLVAGALAAAVALLLCVATLPLREALERYAGVLVLALGLGGLAGVLLSREDANPTRRDWALAAVLLLLPHAYAFGSGRPYWLNAEGAGLFWLLAGAVLAASMRTAPMALRAVVPLAGAAVAASSAFVAAAMEFPMRQPQALRLHDRPVQLGSSEHPLLVARDMADYVHTLRQAAARAGFRPGDPLIDLTGHSPGAVYALDGSAPGIPWLLGGYPGSARYATQGLALAGCATLVRAWLLLEPEGPDQVPASALAGLGLDTQRDFTRVAVANTPQATYKVGKEQHLLAPAGNTDDKRVRCEQALGRQAR